MKSKSVEPILFKDDITIKVDLNGIGFALSARDYKGAHCCIYREVFDGSRRHGYQSLGELCETIQAAYGTGGGNTPIVLEKRLIKPRLVIGIDFYNQEVTGEISKTLNSIRSDSDHVPCVLIKSE